MITHARIFHIFLLLILFVVSMPAQAEERGPKGAIKVGIFPFEPFNFIDTNGAAQGVNADLLREIVKGEKWRVEFISGSWAQCLERLQKEEIDLMVSVAYSPDRAEIMDYSYESVVELWGQIFVRPEGKSYNINDLSGRKVAVMSKDISGSNFIQTAKKFGVHCEIREYTTHADVFAAVQKKEVDAGVAPQHFGLRHAKAYSLVGSTILFSPFSIYFASKKGTQHELLSHIDAHLSKWKSDKESFYYESLNHWLGNLGPGRHIPVWLIYSLVVAISTVLLFSGFILLLKKTVRRKTEALRESETRYRELVENANSIILRIDSEGRIVFLNEYAQSFFGFDTLEIIGKSVIGTVMTERDSARVDLHTMIKDIGTRPQIEITTENETILKDGSRVWISWTNRPFYNESNEITGVLYVGNDITKRRKAEEIAREATMRMQEVVRAAKVGLWDWELASNKVHFSAEWKRQIGYEEDEITDDFAEWESRVHPGDLDSTMIRIKKAIDKKIPEYQVEFRFHHKDGSYRWILAMSSVLIGDNGRAVRVMGSHIDITERKHAEEALRESEERFKVLHDASFGGINIHDNGLILECNQGLAEITGYPREELIGMDVLLLIAPQAREKVVHNIMSGYEEPYEAVGMRKNGEEYPLRLEARAIPYKGKNVGVVEFRNISEYKQFEAEQKKLQTQLLQAQKMESVGRLAGGVAHDFNNMLGVILGHTEMALDYLEPSDPIRVDLQEIKKAAERSANLTRQLLAFARKQTIAPKVLNCNDAVSGMLNMLQRLIGEDINITWSPQANLWPIKVDPSQLDQILANLCVNARDAISGVGKVTIETENMRFDEAYCDNHLGFIPGEYVLLALSDDGCGMDKDTLAHLFEPFFTTKEMGKGTGLGLATVYGIVKQNNGFINVYSELAQGTTFKIFLPRYTDRDECIQTIGFEQPVVRGKETILLVEDEPAILAMTKVMLERLGYTVIPAGTPGEAMRLAGVHKGQINVLLTDVVMPEMNGRDLVKRVMELCPNARTLFMSGYTANVITHHGVLDEGVHFIEKPFSWKILAGKIREVLKG